MFKHINSIKLMCKVLKLCRSTYYKYQKNIISKRAIENAMVSNSIMDIYNDSKGRYGAPKIHKKLMNLNINISLILNL